ncbi:hypothetical protein ES703_124355 [subsurface metagenome]
MKKFLHKKWLSIPVIVVLVLALAAGSVMAAFSFMSVDVDVQVEEAIVVGLFDTWDNLEPYESNPDVVWEDVDEVSGILGDVTISLGEIEGNPTLSIATGEGATPGSGFVAGEWIVIPVNFRNAASIGSVPLTLGATVSPDPFGDYLAVTYIWTENTGTGVPDEDGREFCRDFKPAEDGDWPELTAWEGTIGGGEGMSGSAEVGAQVLFVKITASGDIEAPITYDFDVTFTRN